MIVKTLRHHIGHHIAVWLLLLILPLQAVAAYAPVMPCGDDQGAAMQQAHEGPMSHHAMTAAADPEQSPCSEHQSQGSGTDFDGHSCCHQVFTGAASVILPLVPEAPRVIAQRVALLNTLFIPELPQRPPRA